MNEFKSYLKSGKLDNEMTETMELPSIYDIEIRSLSGDPIDLGQFKGRHILFVNVASKCGFTPQYKDLQLSHYMQEDKISVIGVPCNQFGKQEPGQANEIEAFCERNYGVSFTMTEKIMVKGRNKHPLYQWLTQSDQNGKKNSSVKWNFQKYLVNDKGELVDYFYSLTSPLSKKIIKHLK
ncbi:MAG: glutathione peroxidase [Bacteroidia bacterium]|nr:glutathione peroxidase [Bacteroidia bacterium]